MAPAICRTLLWTPIACLLFAIFLAIFLAVDVTTRYGSVRNYVKTNCNIIASHAACPYVQVDTGYSSYNCWDMTVTNSALQQTAQNASATVQYSRPWGGDVFLDNCNSFTACGSTVWECIYNPKNISQILLNTSAFPTDEVVIGSACAVALVLIAILIAVRRIRASRNVDANTIQPIPGIANNDFEDPFGTGEYNKTSNSVSHDMNYNPSPSPAAWIYPPHHHNQQSDQYQHLDGESTTTAYFGDPDNLHRPYSGQPPPPPPPTAAYPYPPHAAYYYPPGVQPSAQPLHPNPPSPVEQAQLPTPDHAPKQSEKQEKERPDHNAL